MKQLVKLGATSRTEYVFIQDSSVTTGAGKTGLAYNTSGILIYYVRSGGTATSVSPQTLAAANSSWTSGGFKEVDPTNMPGVYRVDIPDAVFASGVNKAVVMISGMANAAPVVLEYQLVAFDPDDAVRAGLTSLPNAAAEAAGGLITRGTGTGQLSVSSGAVIIQSGTGTGQVSLSSGAVIVQSGTGTGQIDLSSGQVKVQSGTGSGQLSVTSGVIQADAVKINNSATAASNLALSAGNMVAFTVGSSSTTTSINTNLTHAANDNYKGRLMLITSGSYAGQMTDITAYNGTTKALTVTALTNAPVNTDTAIIL